MPTKPRSIPCLLTVCSLLLGGAGCSEDASVGGDGAPSAGTSLLSTDRGNGVLADGMDHAIITVTVRDRNGRPVPGRPVVLSATGEGTLLGQPADPTDANGFATGTIASTVAGVKALSALVGGKPSLQIPSATTVTFVSRQMRFTALPFASRADRALAPAVEITIADQNGNRALDAHDTVSLAVADGPPLSRLSGSLTVIAASGLARFADLSLDRVGLYRLTATSPDLADVTSESFALAAGAPAALQVAGLASPRAAGAPADVMVVVRDLLANVATDYTGRVRFSSTDARATLPAGYTFTVADAGVHTFLAGVVLRTAGVQSVAVIDTAMTAISGTVADVVVTAGPFKGFAVTGVPPVITAGTSSAVDVAARDEFGNPFPAYGGTVTFASDDPLADLPANYTFTAADLGIHSFAGGVVLRSAGLRSVSAADLSDSSLRGVEADISVGPAAAALLEVSGVPSPLVAGVAAGATVAARDAYGNLATGYRGTVHLTSDDAAAVLATDHLFGAAEAGLYLFAGGVVLNTVGIHSVTATDTVVGTVTGAQSGIAVVASSPISVGGRDPLSGSPVGSSRCGAGRVGTHRP